ncbi:MAG: RNA polymerase sigma factor [Spirochaetia bacterium]
MSSKKRDEDEGIIQLVQEGRTDLFRRIVEDYTPLLFSLSYRMIGRREEAEDAVQEIFAKAYRALSSFDTSRSFYSWIYTIAINHLRSLNRKKEKGTAPNIPYEDTERESIRKDQDGEAPDELAVKRDGERLAQRAIEKLEPVYREVFVLRMVEGVSGRETSRILDIPENTVKTYLRRARKKLIEEMKNFGWTETPS